MILYRTLITVISAVDCGNDTAEPYWERNRAVWTEHLSSTGHGCSSLGVVDNQKLCTAFLGLSAGAYPGFPPSEFWYWKSCFLELLCEVCDAIEHLLALFHHPLNLVNGVDDSCVITAAEQPGDRWVTEIG